MELEEYYEFFVRIQNYEVEEKSNINNNTWGNWRAYDFREISAEFHIVDGDNNDPRKLFVVTYDFTKSHNDDYENLIEEKKKIMQKLLQLKKKTAYFCQADYGSVQKVADGDVLLGYDALIRYIPLPSLTEYRKNHALLSEEEINKSAKQIALCIASAMNRMHKLGLVHGYIQPDNICVDDRNSEIRYILSIPIVEWFLEDNKRFRKINNYLAPELLNNSSSSFSVQSDIYSLGITIYQILNDGKIPFETAEMSASDAFKKRCKGYDEIPLPVHGTVPMQYIIRKACAYDTDIRYNNINELINDLEKIDGFIPEDDELNKPLSICTINAEAVKKIKEEEQRIEREKQEEQQRIKKEKSEREERQRIGQEKNKRRKERERQETNQENISIFQSVLATEMTNNNINTSQSVPETEITDNNVNNKSQSVTILEPENSNTENDDIGYLPPQPKKGFSLLHVLGFAAVIVGIIFAVSKCMGVPSVDDADISSSQQSRAAESSIVDESSEDITENTDDDLTTTLSEQNEETTIPAITTALATTIRPMTVVTSAAVETNVKTAIPINTTKPQQSVETVYEFVSGKYTWEEAAEYCKTHGGQLATVHSDEEWNSLISVVDSARSRNSDLQYVWLGATSTLNLDNMTISFKWIDNSDTSYIIGNTFKQWYYNSKIGITEPSGYDVYEYTVSGNIVREPYLMLWYVAPETGAKGKEWSLNDICDVSKHSNYKESNMGFVMEKEISASSNNNNNNSNTTEAKIVNTTGTVITERDPLNVRSSPSIEASKLGTVPKDGTVNIVEQVGDWYKIEFNNGYGYVSSEFISVKKN